MNLADRVKETTTSTSADVITLGGSASTFRSFSSAFTVGDANISVSVDDGKGNWENGAYTLTNTATLTRTAIYASSNGGAAVVFPAGSKEVFCTLASKALDSLVADLRAEIALGDTSRFVTSADAPSNADGRSNGTVYFQTGLSSGVISMSVKVSGAYVPVGSAAAADPAYARIRSALAAVSAGTGYAKIGLLGDSTMAGAKAGTSGAASRASTPVTFLRDKLLATQTRPTITSNWVGDQRFAVTNSIDPYTFDTRFSQPDGAGFIATSGATPVSVAGSLLVNTATANRTGFLPEVATDTTDVYYAVNTTLGAFSITRNGGTTVPVNQAGTSGMGKVTYSSPLSSVDPIYISRTSGGAYVIGMDSYNSAIKSIRLFGLGWSGGRAADWAGTLTGFDPLNGLVALGLDLVVLRFGTNDISIPGATTTSTDPAAYQASINKILDAVIGSGTNVILATHYPMNTTVTSQAVQDTYAGYVRSIATIRGLKVHDTYARVGTWAAASAAGKVFDNLHPNAAGYQDDATALAALLLTLA